MTISIIGKLTDHDCVALCQSVRRFADRHSISVTNEMKLSSYSSLEYELTALNDPRLKRLWQACKCRALKVPISASVTISHGYIGNRI